MQNVSGSCCRKLKMENGIYKVENDEIITLNIYLHLDYILIPLFLKLSK